MTKIHEKQTTAQDLMPKDEASRAILEERAKKWSEKIHVVHETPSVDYIRFRSGRHEQYGIPYENIEKVINIPTLTKIPQSADYIAGVINHHGKFLTVIDLKKFFRLSTENVSQNKNILIVKMKEISIGILLDTLEGSGQYEKGKIVMDAATRFAIDPKYIIGIEHGNTTILNMETIIQDLH